MTGLFRHAELAGIRLVDLSAVRAPAGRRIRLESVARNADVKGEPLGGAGKGRFREI